MQIEGVFYRMLKRIFGPKREEVTEEHEKLHSEKLYSLYSTLYTSTPNILCQGTLYYGVSYERNYV